MQWVQTGRYFHTLCHVNRVTVCHVNSSLLQCRTSVRETILNYQILWNLCVNEWSDIGVAAGDDRSHILDAICLQSFFYNLCRSWGDLIDHAPREGNLILIFHPCSEIRGYVAFL